MAVPRCSAICVEHAADVKTFPRGAILTEVDAIPYTELLEGNFTLDMLLKSKRDDDWVELSVLDSKLGDEPHQESVDLWQVIDGILRRRPAFRVSSRGQKQSKAKAAVAKAPDEKSELARLCQTIETFKASSAVLGLLSVRLLSNGVTSTGKIWRDSCTSNVRGSLQMCGHVYDHFRRRRWSPRTCSCRTERELISRFGKGRRVAFVEGRDACR